jgi:ABC-type glycerol-3-phosphate transport system substrate-binding protein
MHCRLVVLSVLVASVLLGACGPAAAPPASGAPAQGAAGGAARPAGQSEWDRTLAAARNERLALNTFSGTKWEALAARFEKAYPDIPLEHTGVRHSDFVPRVIAEQKNGQFLWDVMVGYTTTLQGVLGRVCKVGSAR